MGQNADSGWRGFGRQNCTARTGTPKTFPNSRILVVWQMEAKLKAEGEARRRAEQELKVTTAAAAQQMAQLQAHQSSMGGDYMRGKPQKPVRLQCPTEVILLLSDGYATLMQLVHHPSLVAVAMTSDSLSGWCLGYRRWDTV